MAGTAQKSEPTTIDIGDLTGNPARFARQMRAGHEFVIVYQGKLLARVSPVKDAPANVQHARRQPGLLAGRISVAPDFDLTPADMVAAMEGRDA